MSDQIGSLMGQGSPLATSSPVSGVIPSYGKMLSGFGAPQTLGALQAGTSVLSGLGTMAAYNSRASSDAIQAQEWQTQAGSERVMGQSQVSGLKNQYLSDIGALTSRAAAGGVDVGQGLPAEARQIIGQNAATAEQATSLASDIRARRDLINQYQAQAAAQEAQSAGSLGLIGGILGGGLKLLSAGIL